MKIVPTPAPHPAQKARLFRPSNPRHPRSDKLFSMPSCRTLCPRRKVCSHDVYYINNQPPTKSSSVPCAFFFFFLVIGVKCKTRWGSRFNPGPVFPFHSPPLDPTLKSTDSVSGCRMTNSSAVIISGSVAYLKMTSNSPAGLSVMW